MTWLLLIYRRIIHLGTRGEDLDIHCCWIWTQELPPALCAALLPAGTVIQVALTEQIWMGNLGAAGSNAVKTLASNS